MSQNKQNTKKQNNKFVDTAIFCIHPSTKYVLRMNELAVCALFCVSTLLSITIVRFTNLSLSLFTPQKTKAKFLGNFLTKRPDAGVNGRRPTLLQTELWKPSLSSSGK